MMRWFLLLMAFTTIVFSGTSASAAPGDDEMSQQTVLLSTRLLLAELKKQMANAPISDETLYQTMKQNPSAFVGTENSRKTLLEQCQNALRERYRNEVNALLQGVAQKNPDNRTVLNDEFKNQAIILPDDIVTTNMDQKFPEAFQKARDRIITEQRNTLVSQIFPTELQIDSIARNDLQVILEKQLIDAAGQVIFEENRPFIRDTLIQPMLDDAYAQKQWQIDFINGSASTEPTTPEEFQYYLENLLQSAIDQKRAEDPQKKIYNIFPSTKDPLVARSRTLSLDKFVSHIDQYCAPISNEEIRTELTLNPGRHRELAKSLERFYLLFAQRSRSSAINGYSNQLDNQSRVEMRYFLEQVVPQSEQCNEVLKQFFSSIVTPTITEERKKLAEEQFQSNFPTLANNSFLPTEEQISQFDQVGGDEMVYDLRTLLPSSNFDYRTLLEECDSRAKKQVIDLLQTGSTALKNQQQLLDNSYARLNRTLLETAQNNNLETTIQALQDIMEIPEENRIQDVGDFTEDTVVAAYLQYLSGEWQKIRLATLWPDANNRPPNYATIYTQLFNRTQQDARIRIRALLSDMHNPSALLTADNAAVSNDAILVPVNLNIDASGHYIITTVTISYAGVKQFFQCSAMPKEYDSQEAEQLRLITALVVRTLNELENGKRYQADIKIKVQNGRIFYRFVAKLRQKLIESLENLDKAELSCTIEDSL